MAGVLHQPWKLARNRQWGCTWGNPAHLGLWGPSWKDHWVTGVGVCMRVALPLSDGNQGPAGQLRACSQPWAPGTSAGLPLPSPSHSGVGGGWVEQLLLSVRCPGPSRGREGGHLQSGLAWACYSPTLPHLTDQALCPSAKDSGCGLAQSRAWTR